MLRNFGEMKTILITGASSGLGKEAAKLFQFQGWNVIATMRTPEKENELINMENVFTVKMDVSDPISVHDAVIAGISRFGHIDVLLNNAGYGVMGAFESATSEQMRQQYEVNVFGLMAVTQAVLPYMREKASGTIINISSFGGQVALPFGSLYNSSKFAVEGFSESLSHELRPLGILVKLIEPGSVATNFRNGLDMINNTAPAYGPLLSSFFARFIKTTEQLAKATPEEVAVIIYEAATDGSGRLRYVIGADAQFYIDAKANHSDVDFINLMRSHFINA
jgi:NAD(P)-dependent dehydrogenase (short-subunit alcohol dehydrogenase family)